MEVIYLRVRKSIGIIGHRMSCSKVQSRRLHSNITVLIRRESQYSEEIAPPCSLYRLFFWCLSPFSVFVESKKKKRVF